MQNLYGQGGRSFWIHNTGPVGCLPYVLDRLPVPVGQIDKVGCAEPFNEVCRFYNTKLKEAVEQLQNDLPLAAFTYVDIYSVKYDLISNASKYGTCNFPLLFFLCTICVCLRNLHIFHAQNLLLL